MFRKSLLRTLLLISVILALSVPGAFAQDGQ